MKCIDTPLLEDLLWGRTRAKVWLRRTRNEGEVATTEVSMSALGLLAQRGGSRGGAPRAARLAALEHLRRALTVLPLDAPSVERTLGLPLPPPGRSEGLEMREIVGICLAHGVEELFTSKRRWVPRPPSALRVVRV